MIWKDFKTADSLEKELLNSIETNIRISLKENNEALILLSGGSTPLSLYKKFKEIKKIDWSKIKFGLVDERWVNNSSKDSNFYNISEALGGQIIEKSTFIPLVYDELNEKKNISQAKKANIEFLGKKTIVILGMGTDGHTASLFPDNSKTEIAISQLTPNILDNIAPVSPKNRITHNLKSIFNSKKVILYIKGQEKKNVLEKSKIDLLPISYVINTLSTQVETFWTK
ncbi:MAG: 6-phosphogluconolactonase [Flavobacteriales bacterium]|nr:6-phosphogluconolactonase [Flavobacteriales bacterium]MDG1440788.1 6-phosphogluconolactonase [Flavobacteriales bacterium]MDG1797523.1 6-phosphogluconolactonase [Flavobacteriales bacterium]